MPRHALGVACDADATEVDGIYQGSCAIVENTACASRLFCWGLSSGGDAAAQVTGDPTCMDLSSLPGTSSQTFSGSVSGLYAGPPQELTLGGLRIGAAGSP